MKTHLNWFDKLMIAITFAEENSAGTVMEVGTKCRSNGPCLTLFGKDKEDQALSSGEVGSEAKA